MYYVCRVDDINGNIKRMYKEIENVFNTMPYNNMP